MIEIEIPVAKPKVNIDEDVKNQIQKKVDDESQVIIHCTYKGSGAIRIWKSTFLFAKDSSHQSKLVQAENITLYSTWTPVRYGEKKSFSLIFTGLPKTCKVFDLIEKIPEPGGFEVRNIIRNISDIYHLEV